MSESAQSGNPRGLSEAEVSEIRRRDGYNELPSDRPHGIWPIVREVVFEPMLFLLLSCSAIYFIVGDRAEALLLSFFVCFVVAITFVQRYKAEKALEALKNLSSPRALVIRDGKKVRIPGREVVVGDIMVIEEGDRIPADGIVISTRECYVNESVLTGESVPVGKKPGRGEPDGGKPGGDGTPYVFANTLVVKGNAVARVKATGVRTQVGSIGTMLNAIHAKKTRLERDIGDLVRKSAVVGVVVCLVASLLVLLSGHGAVQSLLTGLSLAMSLLPEELPVVLMVFLALGVIRLSKLSVLTRRMPVIESLGSATVLCVDKTGTLTENNMRLAAVNVGGERMDFSETPDPETNASLYRLLETATLACDAQTMDPIDNAIQSLTHGSRKFHAGRLDYLYVGHVGVAIPFIRAYLYETEAGGKVVVAKGAPESAAALCRMDTSEKKHLLELTDGFASEGYRVLAVVRADIKKGDLMDVDRERFSCLGLLAFEDPVRESAVSAVRECRDAGVRVVIVTGDYAETARHVAMEVGLPGSSVIEGGDLERMTDDELSAAIEHTDIFARVVPSQKLRLIEMLKRHHEIVGMTGDGVNDAPALKSAHIGIAMGQHGTDVARESASMVLLDDDFSSIVAAIRVGRKVYDNIKKAASYILAIHVPIAGLALLPSVLGIPPILQPVHIAVLELLIDPACSIVFEAEEEEGDVMRRPPRPVGQSLFGGKDLLLRLLQGGIALLAVSVVVMVFWSVGYGEEEMRNVGFVSLIMANVALILSNLSWGTKSTLQDLRSNGALKYMLAGIAVIFGAMYAVPALRELFHIAPPTGLTVMVGIAALVSVYGASELIEKLEFTVPSERKMGNKKME